jgi:hypothetical protein
LMKLIWKTTTAKANDFVKQATQVAHG